MKSNDMAVVAVFAMACLLAMVFQLRPLFRAWARRVEGSGENAELMHEIAELRERVAELESGHGRLQELEERVDFAERMMPRRGILPEPETMDTPV
jgi:Tfp pilus assembly protein PilO